MGPSTSTVLRSRAIPALKQDDSPAAGRPRLTGLDRMQARRRADIIASHMSMAARIARTFAGRGEDLDDLTQVAMLELVKAATRFDPTRGVAFAQYAYPCIVGALKKHFRDTGWTMRVSRRMQELHLQTSRALPVLTQLLGRTPTMPDLAEHLQLSEKDTRDGLSSGQAYRPLSLSAAVGDSRDAVLVQQLGGLDERLESVPDRYALAQHIAALTARERAILDLRFIDDLTQSEIAEHLGISQMHVSRLLSRSMVRLRSMIATADGNGAATSAAPAGVTLALRPARDHIGDRGAE